MCFLTMDVFKRKGGPLKQCMGPRFLCYVTAVLIGIETTQDICNRDLVSCDANNEELTYKETK